MLASGLPEDIADDEDLARFLPSSSLFNSAMAKPAAFLPSLSDRETSVFRHGSEPREPLWQIFSAHVSAERTCHGAAIVKAGDVRSVGLNVLSDEPPPKHAVIGGWPWLDEDPVLQKAQQKERAAEIASKSILVLR